jgi:hypothetical protein
MSTPPSYKNIVYEVIFHNKDTDLPIKLFESIEYNSDYNNNIADHIIVNVQMGTGDYVFDVFKYKDNIELTINIKRDNVLYSSRTYKAILINTTDNMSGIGSNIDKESLNKSGLTRVNFQLVDTNVEVLRVVKTSGIYKDMNMKDAIVAILNNGCSTVKVNGETLTPIINIVEPNNTTSYKHILIPTGTRLIDIPTYFQDNNYGVYSGDIGIYIKNKRIDINQSKLNLYVYPLYTTESDNYDDLIIYHSDGKLNKSSDNTYTISQDSIKIVSNELSIMEIKQNKLMDKGGAVTGSNPDNLLMYNSEVTDSSVSYDNSKQVSNSTLETTDGLVNERYVGNEVNMYKHTSKVFDDSMDLVKIIWKYSNADLLHPGMNAKIYYQVDSSVRVMKGVLQRSYTVYNAATKLEETILLLKVGDVNEN